MWLTCADTLVQTKKKLSPADLFQSGLSILVGGWQTIDAIKHVLLCSCMLIPEVCILKLYSLLHSERHIEPTRALHSIWTALRASLDQTLIQWGSRLPVNACAPTSLSLALHAVLVTFYATGIPSTLPVLVNRHLIHAVAVHVSASGSLACLSHIICNSNFHKALPGLQADDLEPCQLFKSGALVPSALQSQNFESACGQVGGRTSNCCV